MLSASANKLSRLKEQAEEYAALIMEELDPEGLGYIEVNNMSYPVSSIICGRLAGLGGHNWSMIPSVSTDFEGFRRNILSGKVF